MGKLSLLRLDNGLENHENLDMDLKLIDTDFQSGRMLTLKE